MQEVFRGYIEGLPSFDRAMLALNPMMIVPYVVADMCGEDLEQDATDVVEGFSLPAVAIGMAKQDYYGVGYRAGEAIGSLLEAVALGGASGGTIRVLKPVIQMVPALGRVLQGIRNKKKQSGGLEKRGYRPKPGTRIRPEGLPENWRISGTDGVGGTKYYDPSNIHNNVRVMQGDPNSPFPNSWNPYVRWQKNGRALDKNGNVVNNKKSPDAHIPLDEFQFKSELFK